jgi:hypothetical protein
MKHRPALFSLLRLHAELGGKIKENRKEVKQFVGDMKHVEAVIKLLEPSYNVRNIATRRRYKPNPLFQARSDISARSGRNARRRGATYS